MTNVEIKENSKEYFLRSLVDFAKKHHKTIVLDGQKIAVVFLSDIVDFAKIIETENRKVSNYDRN